MSASESREPQGGQAACSGCAGRFGRVRHRLASPRGPVVKCGLCALTHGPLVRNALRTSAVVGTILTLINQGGALWASGTLTAGDAARILLTYFVPYAVATYTALVMSRLS